MLTNPYLYWVEGLDGFIVAESLQEAVEEAVFRGVEWTSEIEIRRYRTVEVTPEFIKRVSLEIIDHASMAINAELMLEDYLEVNQIDFSYLEKPIRDLITPEVLSLQPTRLEQVDVYYIDRSELDEIISAISDSDS